MEVYLMQHGRAVPEEENRDRPLNSEGRTQVEASARAICRMGIRFDIIISSPKTRSRQTAEVVANATGYSSESIIETDAIRPSSTPEETLAFLDQFRNKYAIFVAGHLPSLPKLAAVLLSGSEEPTINFTHAGLCRIDTESMRPKSGVLQFYVTPTQLLQLSG